jgi:Replication protein
MCKPSLDQSIAHNEVLSQESLSSPKSGAAAPLGIHAKLRTGLEKDQASQSAERRLQRYSLQSAARELLPRERVACCLRLPIPDAGTIDIYRNPEYSRTSFGGLQVCASVWVCPVCSSKITERRRVDLASGVQFWREQAGGFLLLVTYTLRHNMGDSLESLLSGLLWAFERVHKGGWWTRFQDKHRIYGKIRALEVTHGDRGWHPHMHCLYFIGSGDLPAVNGFEFALKVRWITLLQMRHYDATWEHGVDVRISDESIAEYIAKWGHEPRWTMEHEMTKSPSKVGKWHNKTAFQLLSEYNEGNSASGRLFVQYAANFKGKSQLHWSRGLRSLLHLDADKSDETLAKEREKGAALWAQLTREQWRVILGNDARAEIVRLGDAGDVEAFWAFVDSLPGARRS